MQQWDKSGKERERESQILVRKCFTFSYHRGRRIILERHMTELYD